MRKKPTVRTSKRDETHITVIFGAGWVTQRAEISREMAQKSHMETMLEEMIKQIKNVYNKAHGLSWKVEKFWGHRIGKWVTASATFQEMVSN